MQDLDLVIRNGTACTASDIFKTDIGIKDGKIVALSTTLPQGTRDIDASDRLVLPGGIGSHCHMEQMTSSGTRTVDDLASGTRSAADSGSYTLICFSTQANGGTVATNVRE